jgi:Holliday junction resolvase RusA-like endonuclease
MDEEDLPVPPSLLAEWPDGALVRKEVLELYELQTGNKLRSPTPTPDEEAAVVAWWNKNYFTVSGGLLRSSRVRVPAYSTSLSSKVSRLAQFHCPICATKEGLFPVYVIPIRIRPVSKQAQDSRMRGAFERAIRFRFSDGRTQPFSAEKSICLLIVFVVHATKAQKDLDNMAKALIDAVKLVLFGDDRQIDHLNIIRIKSPEEEYVYLNVRQTQLNEHKDVLFPRMMHSWAGAEVLNLDDFLEPPA